MNSEISIHVHLNPAIYRRFCRFDNFRRQHRWFVPIMTGMIMITISMALLFFGKSASQSTPGILMGLGIAFPLFCFGIYIIQIEAQISKQNLRTSPEIYALVLRSSGVRVTGMQQVRSHTDLEWADFWGAFRYHSDIYLYVSPSRAFILPTGQADVPDDQVWSYLQQMLGTGRCIATKGFFR